MSNDTTNDATIFADGFDDAILGLHTCPKDGCKRVVYDKASMIKILRVRDGMSYTTALEFLEHNTWYAFVGTLTPLFVDDMTAVDITEHIDNQ